MRTQKRSHSFAVNSTDKNFLKEKWFSLNRLEQEYSTVGATFEFEIIEVDTQGQVSYRQHGQSRFFPENLGGEERLEMVAIPRGIFQMGALEIETGREHEGPQHSVTVNPFFMSKYPVTQAQWRAVATLPPINRPLNLDPASFKGDNKPVERVSWHDAIEFCSRLAQLTGRKYRLPSEAEWEYACRAGTTTPFHFGETITTALANYDGRFICSNEVIPPSCPPANPPTDPPANPPTDPPTCPSSGFGYSPNHSPGITSSTSSHGCSSNHQSSVRRFSFRGIYNGKSHQQTNQVGSFQTANNFGLYDMHGNVWEWCADHWHNTYAGSPLDGSAWLSNHENQYRVMRGGSWINYPEFCRATARAKAFPYDFSPYIGFRVVCTFE